MQAPDDSVHWMVGKSLFRVSQNIDDARVPAAGQHHQALRRVEHQRLILRNVVFDQPARLLHFPAGAPVALRVFTWHGAGQPSAREDVESFGVLNTFSAASFIIFTNSD